jgi:hypothetical protein
MKKLIFATAVVVAICPPFVAAVDFAFQPRLETGAMYYDLDVDDVAQIESGPLTQPVESGSTISSNSKTGFEFKSWMPFIGGGGTFFADKFFVDVSAQYADNGSDSSSTSDLTPEQVTNFPIPGIPPDRLFSQTTLQNNNTDSDFDRTEWAVSVGYAITNHFALYAGYKSAQTDFEAKRNGSGPTRRLWRFYG